MQLPIHSHFHSGTEWKVPQNTIAVSWQCKHASTDYVVLPVGGGGDAFQSAASPPWRVTSAMRRLSERRVWHWHGISATVRSA